MVEREAFFLLMDYFPVRGGALTDFSENGLVRAERPEIFVMVTYCGNFFAGCNPVNIQSGVMFGDGAIFRD